MSAQNQENAGDAASYNRRVLSKLTRALARQPDVDLSAALPASYHSMLASKKGCDNPQVKPDPQTDDVASEPPLEPCQSPSWTLNETSLANIIYELSPAVESLLDKKQSGWRENGQTLSLAMSRILQSATFLFQATHDCDHFVARCDEKLVVKAVTKLDSTEYTTLQFLETKCPAALAPKPHGMVSIDKVWYMFMSLVPGVSLETAWPRLTDLQKEALSHDLNALILQLREVPFDEGRMLGGVAGQPCKDRRRHTRIADFPIYTGEQLWEFMYGSARRRDTVYGRFLRKQAFPSDEEKVVLTHGDLRSANVMVSCHADGLVEITGLIDWEMSGYYPESFECIKALNTLSPIGDDDWYLYLPECINPRRYIASWHANMVWDRYVVWFRAISTAVHSTFSLLF